jgi:hypothetical protein
MAGVSQSDYFREPQALETISQAGTRRFRSISLSPGVTGKEIAQLNLAATCQARETATADNLSASLFHNGPAAKSILVLISYSPIEKAPRLFNILKGFSCADVKHYFFVTAHLK